LLSDGCTTLTWFRVFLMVAFSGDFRCCVRLTRALISLRVYAWCWIALLCLRYVKLRCIHFA